MSSLGTSSPVSASTLRYLMRWSVRRASRILTRMAGPQDRTIDEFDCAVGEPHLFLDRFDHYGDAAAPTKFGSRLTRRPDRRDSHVVDPASIATSRRRRRAKTDKIDGEALVRALLAYKRGEPRVCAMVRAPTPQEEDRRRICRERKTLTAERVEHVNRIKGLLFAQGISDYEPLRRKRRERLEALRTGGRQLPEHLTPAPGAMSG